jgi:DNA-3-methyladenine glycosylase II
MSMSKRIITQLSKQDAILGAVIEAAGPYTVKADLEGTPFQALARAIAHQQLHAAAANTILGRFINTVGGGTFPTPEQVLAAPEPVFRAAGFSGSKTAALKDLATKTLEGVVPDRATLLSLSDTQIIERLTQVRGIGRWTVEMMLMFQLGRPDILPVDDFGIRNGFRLAYGLRKTPAPKALALFGERWSPHRSTAAWYLWRAVELHRDGKLPKPSTPTRLPRLPRLRRTVKTLKKRVRAKVARVRGKLKPRPAARRRTA